MSPPEKWDSVALTALILAGCLGIALAGIADGAPGRAVFAGAFGVAFGVTCYVLVRVSSSADSERAP